MKVAVLNNSVPFLQGGAEHLADALVTKLREFGHQAMLVRIPFRWNPPEIIPEQMLACRLFQLPNVDRAIGLKFPAYFVPHENKVLWLLHQFRQAYDLWGTEFQGLPNSGEGARIRAVVTAADNRFLSETKRIYTNSKVTGDRLRKFNGIESEVLLPPLLLESRFVTKEYGNFILCLGRINAMKRQHLLVQAMQYCQTDVTLVVAGKSESESDEAALRDAIRANGNAKRVEVIDRYISEDQKIDLMGRCLACAYIPYDEDSYGYVTLEACLSRKAVITCTDSGGIDTLVTHGATGYIVPPEPRGIADAMDSLYSDKAGTRKMGERGYELARSLNINWDRVIQVLTA